MDNCGCSISVHGDPTKSLDEFLDSGGQFRFNYCPLHAAAPRMAEELERFVYGQIGQRAIITYYNRSRALLAEIKDKADG